MNPKPKLAYANGSIRPITGLTEKQLAELKKLGKRPIKLG